MNKKLKINAQNLLLMAFFSIGIFSLNLTGAIAQEKEDQCEILIDNLQKFYKQCYSEDFLDRYSPKLLESFTKDQVTHEDEMGRLDTYLTQLANSPGSTAYIVVYGGRTNKYGEYDIRVGRITDYIFGFRNQDKSRIKIVNGGFREKFEFELWLSPIKNAFPPIAPTIAPERVKFRGKMKPFGL